MAHSLKCTVATLLLCCVFLSLPGQHNKKKKDLWQSLPEIEANIAVNKKPVLIDVYTKWCYYCKVMDATTYRKDSIYNYLKNNFYRFKFNAETKDTISWQNKHYVYNKLYQVNDFAVYLTRGNIVYPTTVIIAPGGQPFYLPVF